MKITTFTGVKNVGALGIDMQMQNTDDDNDSTLEYRCVNLQLNNKGNKDLDNFERVLKKYPNSVNKDFLTIQTFQTRQGEFDVPTPDITLNFKDLEVNDENLWIYEKLVKLLSDVSKKPSKEFETNEGYLESEDCQKMLYPLNICGLDEIDQEIMLRTCHDPEMLSGNIKNMTDSLEQAVYDYLA